MIGETISHYKITAKLGAGGMGEVYLAEDLDLGRKVAVKFLSADKSSDEESRQRFIHEARAQAMLNHPNVATFFEVGESDGRAFIVMEYIEGVPVRQYIEETKPSIETILDLAIQIGSGLRAAHDKGVIHRDVKPDNIMVTSDGLVKITDFGLARWMGATTLTKTGTRMGTAFYMSPEQAEGRRVDHRSDIFSLGAVLYELFTGQRPFVGDNEAIVLYELTSKEPEPLARYCRDVPDDLCRIVMKCLAKRPEERFQSCADLVADLTALARGAGSVSADAPGHDRAMLVVLPFENMGAPDDEYFADGITEEITSRLSAMQGLGVISRTSAMQYKGTDKRIRQIAAELSVDYVLEGSVRWSRNPDGHSRLRITPQLIQASDDTHLWSERYDRVMDDVFAIQSEIAEKVISQLQIQLHPFDPDIAEHRHTASLDAYHAYLRGRFYAGKPHFDLDNWMEAIRNFQLAVTLDPDYALAHAELARAHARLYYLRADPSEERCDLAWRSITKAQELAPEAPEVRFSLGYYYFWAKRDAQRALEEFAAIASGLAERALLLDAKGEALRHLGRWPEALEQFQEGCRLDPRNASLIVELAETCWWMRRYADADALSDDAIALAPDQMWPYLTKAFNSWCWNGALDDSRAALEAMPRLGHWGVWSWFWQEVYEKRYTEALKRLTAIRGDWLSLKIGIRPKALLHAYIHEWTGDSSAAIAEFKKALSMLEPEIEAHPNDPRYRSSLAIVCAALGQRDRAVQEGQRAVELYPVSKDAVYGWPYVIDQAHVYTLLNEPKSAVELLDSCLSVPNWITVAYLKVDPRWNRLHDDRGFQRLLERGDIVF
jgi:serine/threonine protein kinase/tetratricopeptide (TPR) repeat protein